MLNCYVAKVTHFTVVCFGYLAFDSLTSLHLHTKNSEVCIKTKSTSASLLLKRQSQVTTHSNVKRTTEYVVYKPPRCCNHTAQRQTPVFLAVQLS